MSVSEKEMSNTFSSIVTNSQLPKFPKFAHALPEVTYNEGRADFVCSSTGIDLIPKSDSRLLATALATVADARILSLVRQDQTTSFENLVEWSGFTDRTTRRSVNKLEDLGLIRSNEKGGFLLLPSPLDITWEFWSFELKVKDWKKALYQALRSKTFAQNATVVVAEKWSHRAKNNLTLFSNLSIGLASLDHQTGEFKVFLPPKRRRPGSKFHYYYALGKFLGRTVGE